MSRAALDTRLWSLRPSSVTYRCEATKLFFFFGIFWGLNIRGDTPGFGGHAKGQGDLSAGEAGCK